MRTALVLVVLAACGQSRRQAWQTICEAPRGQAADVAAWMRDHVTNREAQHDINSLGAIDRSVVRKDCEHRFSSTMVVDNYERLYTGLCAEGRSGGAR